MTFFMNLKMSWWKEKCLQILSANDGEPRHTVIKPNNSSAETHD